MERKVGLDILRALAILIVVEQHGRAIINEVFPQFNLLGSTDGVDIFFVLSGFLIGGIIIRDNRNNSFDINYFLGRRWYRTLPNFYVALLLSLVIYIVFTENKLIDIKLIFQTAFFIQNYIGPFENYAFFSEAWSLSIEEHFYLTFSLLLFIFIKLKVKESVLYTMIVLTVIAFVSRIIIAKSIIIGDYGTYNSSIRTIIPCRLDSLTLGVLMSYFKDKFYSVFSNRFNSFLMFLIGLFFCIYFDRTYLLTAPITPFVIMFHSLLFSFGVALLLPFLDSLKMRDSVLKSSILFISKISYSMYLYHNFIFAQPISQLVYDMNYAMKIYFYIIYWIFVISVSFFMFTFLEMPFLKIRDKYYPVKNA